MNLGQFDTANGPTIYRLVADKVLPDPEPFVAEALDGVQAKLTMGLRRALEQAYVEGLRDGFQQGVAAAEADNG